MIVYLDLVFFVNVISDALALYVTSKLSGVAMHPLRWIFSSCIGGMYGVLCLPFVSIGRLLLQMIVSMGMVGLVFPRKGRFLCQYALFLLLSCMIGGVLVVLIQCSESYSNIQIVRSMNWRNFFLSGFLTYTLLSVVFREGIRHKINSEIYTGEIMLNGKGVSLNVLLDTGHTLSDPYTGIPVLTAWYGSIKEFWTTQEQEIIAQLDTMGALWCLEKLNVVSPGKFRLIPYRAVGIQQGMMLCFRANELFLDKTSCGVVTIAISPTIISEGEGYTALWGGDIPQKRRKNESESMDHNVI